MILRYSMANQMLLQKAEYFSLPKYATHVNALRSKEFKSRDSRRTNTDFDWYFCRRINYAISDR